ncbi:solute carrier family 31 (copper transporter) member 1 [Microdochium nivale]|nr:solute carrier family 31 (copper transporter) member 1 [Microdochium nivale]
MDHYKHHPPLGGSHQDMMMPGHDHHAHHAHHHHDPHAGHHAHHHHHHGAAADPAAACSMNMLLNWSTTDLCIFTHHLRIPAGSWPLWAAGLAFVFLFCAGYEGFKAYARRYDRWVAREYHHRLQRGPLAVLDGKKSEATSGAPTPASSSSSSASASGLEIKGSSTTFIAAQEKQRTSLSPNATTTTTTAAVAAGSFAARKKYTRALLHAAQYMYGMLAMLLFMTYNAQVMFACAAGAGCGFLRWAGDVPPGGGGARGEAVEEEEEEQGGGACH